MPMNYKNGSDHQESTPRRRIQSQTVFPGFSGSGQIHHSSPTLLRSMTSGAMARRSSVSRLFGLKRPPRRCTRPDLTKAAFENVTSALRSGIDIYQAELSKRKETVSGSPRVSRAGFYYDADKQIKTLERLIRTLESHRDRVEVLQDGYMLRYRLREGADNLATALVTHLSRQSKTTLLEVKAERKEVIEQMCKIEDSLEQLMGSFYVKVVGLVGFARLCSGDVFEAKLQMGEQKWKSKCKVQKSQQQWQDNEVVFLSKLNSEISVKLVEARRLQGNVQIGSCRCSTKDLMTVQPQKVTLVLKGASSVRLAVVCFWSPWLEGESVVFDLPENELVLGHRQGSDVAVPLSVSRFDSSDHFLSCDWTTTGDELCRSTTVSPKRVLVTPSGDPKPQKRQTESVGVAYSALSRAFEKYQGQYSELAEFEKLLVDLKEVLQYERRSLKHNSMTLSESSALEQFQFLEKVALECGDDCGIHEEEYTNEESQSALEGIMSSPCLLHTSVRVSLDSGKGYSMSSAGSGQSPCRKQKVPQSATSPIEKKYETILTTGSTLLDKALVHHLRQCRRYTKQLTSYGPLRFQESEAVKKLIRRTEVIHQLSLLVATDCSLTIDEVMPELNDSPELAIFWSNCCGNNALFVGVNDLIVALDSQFGASLWANYMAVANNVFPAIVSCIRDDVGDDMDSDQSGSIVTVYDYYDHFTTVARKGLTEYIFRFAKDLLVTDGLMSKEKEEQEQAMESLANFGFSDRIIQASCSLFAKNDSHTTAVVGAYVERVAQSCRQKVLNILLSLLENSDQHIRQGACTALGILKANEAISELVYLAKCDFVIVKEAARQALMACGEEAQTAMLQSLPTTFNDLGPVHTLVPQEVL